jgi:hypothetical protein
MLSGDALFPPHLEVTRHYKIPIIAIQEYIASHTAGPITWDPSAYGDQWLPLWSFDNHPHWPYHQVIGEFLAAVWKLHHDELFSKHDSTSHFVDHYEVPPRMRSHSDVMDRVCLFSKTTVLPVDVSTNAVKFWGDWRVGEDVLGNSKPGWWLDSASGGTASFEIQVRKRRPLISILYLQSYEKMGEFEVFLEGKVDERIKINGLDKESRVSVSVYRVMCIPRSAGDAVDKESADYSFPYCDEDIRDDRNLSDAEYVTMTLKITLLPLAWLSTFTHNKIKILTVQSC